MRFFCGFCGFCSAFDWILLPLDSMCSLVLHVSSCGFVFSCRGGCGGGGLHFLSTSTARL